MVDGIKPKEGDTMCKAEVIVLIQSLKNIGLDTDTINAIVTAVVSGIPYEPANNGT